MWAFLLCESNDRLMTWFCVPFCSSVRCFSILDCWDILFFGSSFAPWIVSLLLSLNASPTFQYFIVLMLLSTACCKCFFFLFCGGFPISCVFAISWCLLFPVLYWQWLLLWNGSTHTALLNSRVWLAALQKFLVAPELNWQRPTNVVCVPCIFCNLQAWMLDTVHLNSCDHSLYCK
jgi:hypothetical protein